MKRKLLILLIISLILNTGCWDMIDIEERILPYSVGIDLKKEDQKGAEDRKFFISFSYPNINALGKNPTQKEQVYIINANANSIFDATDEVSDRTHNPIFLKHLNVLIMSEEVFSDQDNVREILDGLQRDFIVNKMINIVITEKSAYELLLKKLESKRQETVIGLLVSLLQNEQQSNKFSPITLMEFIKDMDHKKVAIVPLATPKEEIVISGGGLFKDYKFIDYIDEKMNRDIAILTDGSKKDESTFDYKGDNISIMNTELKHKKKLIEAGKKGKGLKLKITVKGNGNLQQYIIKDGKGIDKEETIKDIEETLNKGMQEELSSTVKKLQNEYKADALGILEYLCRFHPKVYEEVKDDWDNIFPQIDIEIEVKLTIRRVGLRN